MGELIKKSGIEKRSGVSAEDISFIYSLFGMSDAESIVGLAEHIEGDVLLKKIFKLNGTPTDINNKVIDNFLIGMGLEKGNVLNDELIKALQTDIRTKSVEDGVVIGDDTTIIKTGKKMENISIVHDHSNDTYGWGYCLPTTHYADDEKNYPLFFDFRIKSDEEKKVAEEEKLRKNLKIDKRSSKDIIKWLDYQIANGNTPDVVDLRGSFFNANAVNEMKTRSVNWVGVSPKNRKYKIAGKWVCVGKITSGVDESVYTLLEDDGHHRVIIKKGEMNGVGEVNLMIVNNIDEDITNLYVTEHGNDKKSIDLLTAVLNKERECDETKLKLMLEQLARTRECGVVAENTTFDRWFYAVWFINAVLELGYRRVVIKTKKNIIYIYDEKEMTAGEVGKTIPPEEYAYHKTENIRTASRVVYQEGIGNVKLVFVEELNNQGKVAQAYSLMCTDPDCEDIKVFHIHKKRWPIETFYRELKQNHGLNDFHMRKFNGIRAHVLFVFISFIILTVLSLFNPRLLEKTLGWIKRQYINALVKIKETDEGIMVRFTKAFIEDYGLPMI
ncbi:MAG: hypothetical protein COS36_06405 [Candidatus Altarchaeum sp. CG03_land_8_20_14_0_80_32_618]|nr:MAG: hypothetical protein COS36_06405 [Candidatus Altarchaeum sp. CG03_land_8_20_14_0_80_32_618]